MKKVIDVLILLMLCIFLFSSCKQKQIKVINFEEIANATKIEYTHYMKDTSSTKIIENTDTINQIANWLNDLSLEEIFLSENEIPIDANEKEFYSFIVYFALYDQSFLPDRMFLSHILPSNIVKLTSVFSFSLTEAHSL